MNVAAFTVAPDETTASQLEKELREAIIRLDLLPGTRLSEQEIATRYGVSRQPVREALIALAKSGLVGIRPNRGTIVVRISLEKMQEAQFVREALETAVVRRGCERFDPFLRDRISRNIVQQERALSQGDPHLFRQLDGQFHVLIARGAGCELAWSAIADMKAHMDRACNLTLRSPAAREPLLVQHREIVAALDARDPDRAEAAMRGHLQSILHDIAVVEAERPELFE